MDLSNIAQMDGADVSCDTLSDTDVSQSTECDTEDEIEPDNSPIVLTPATKPNSRQMKISQASSLPLITVLNARSLYNKPGNFKKLLTELGIEVAICSETWEREDKPLTELLQLKNYKINSHRRPKVKANKQPGGPVPLFIMRTDSKLPIWTFMCPKG